MLRLTAELVLEMQEGGVLEGRRTGDSGGWKLRVHTATYGRHPCRFSRPPRATFDGVAGGASERLTSASASWRHSNREYTSSCSPLPCQRSWRRGRGYPCPSICPRGLWA